MLNAATADMAFALLMACARRLPEANAYAKSGAWVDYQNMVRCSTAARKGSRFSAILSSLSWVDCQSVSHRIRVLHIAVVLTLRSF